MRPFNTLRRAPALAGVALLTSFAAGGVAAAGTDPAPPAGTSTASSGTGDSSPDIPGGEIPEALTEGTWFDDEGRLWSPEASSVSDDKHAAFCDFLFGTPDEIAEAFGLDGLELVEGSGFEVRGGGGTGFQCGYDPADGGTVTTDASDPSPATDFTGANDAPDATDGVDSEGGEASSDPDEDDDQPMIVFVVWSEPLDEDDETEGIAAVFVVDGGDEARSAGLAVTDEFGREIDADFVVAWLTAARDRVA